MFWSSVVCILHYVPHAVRPYYVRSRSYVAPRSERMEILEQNASAQKFRTTHFGITLFHYVKWQSAKRLCAHLYTYFFLRLFLFCVFLAPSFGERCRNLQLHLRDCMQCIWYACTSERPATDCSHPGTHFIWPLELRARERRWTPTWMRVE